MPITTSVQFRAGSVEPDLLARSEPSTVGQVARRDLERYYDILRREFHTVAFTDAEWTVLRLVALTVVFEPSVIPMLWAHVDNVLRQDGLAEKWAIDGAALVAKLRNLRPAQAVAVVDALERECRAGVTKAT